MMSLDKDKIIKNVSVDLNTNDDALLKILLERVINHFKSEYAVEEIDDKLAFIFEDCVIKRFNRRGAEGAKSESIDGHSMSYYDNETEFKPYDNMLQRLYGNSDQTKDGEVLFL
ncbi:phage head-tail connector protein [Streptococcus thermophilus]|uniref:phage head-tail connector protein n=1 Tax=Streptococcus thermophilus TaxID=1308 RepID=UPI003A813A4F